MIFSVATTLSLLCFATGVLSSPLSSLRRRTTASVPDISFNNWGGLSSLNGFDNFYGSNNFYGSSNEQVVIVEEEQVCHTQSVEIIQQQLAIIQEFSKRIILQQICDVETQVIVLQQFRGGLHQFQSDVTRQSGRDIGYDQSVSELIVQILQSDGSFNSNSFGFSGTDVGKNLVVPSGSNWNNDSSPKNISTILQTIHNGTNTTAPSRR